MPGSGLVMGGWMGGAISANVRVGKKKVEIMKIKINNSFRGLPIFDLRYWQGLENLNKLDEL